MFTLVHPIEEKSVPAVQLIAKCALFRNNPDLGNAPYAIRSSVSVEVFREFVTVIEDEAVPITHTNLSGLALLCDEFGFESLTMRVSAAADPATHIRIAALEERDRRRERDIAALFTRLSGRPPGNAGNRRVLSDFETFRFSSESAQARLRAELDRARADTARLAAAVEALSAQVSALAAGGSQPTITADVAVLQAWTMPAIDSVIIEERPVIAGAFLDVFAQFRWKRFSLLWRGGRDGFAASDFHRRCDGRPNTLTLIVDSKESVFGGYTPVKWESRRSNGKTGDENNCRKSDPSATSFLFTLKNVQDVARRFALNPKDTHRAIVCDAASGPNFYDIGVSDHCDANSNSFSRVFRLAYSDDTGMDGWTFDQRFTVKEIEVFQIAD
jgi:hypothetical protein